MTATGSPLIASDLRVHRAAGRKRPAPTHDQSGRLYEPTSRGVDDHRAIRDRRRYASRQSQVACECNHEHGRCKRRDDVSPSRSTRRRRLITRPPSREIVRGRRGSLSAGPAENGGFAVAASFPLRSES
jgi:hypothetical protein